jgi:hypothetical protein
MPTKFPFRLITIVLALGLVAVGSIFIVQQVIAGDDIVTELKSRLQERNVPVKNVELTSILPRQITVTLTSTSSALQVSPDDPRYTAIVQQETAILKRNGRAIDRLQIIIQNTNDKEITRADLSADQAIELPPSTPLDTEDTALAETLRDQMQLGKMTLDDLEVTKTAEGHQMVHMKLTASNLEVVNRSLVSFMRTLEQTTNQMHDKGTPLASVSVDIFDPTGQPFLKYSLTFLSSRASETWWMAPGVTQDWFPHPMSTATPSK